MRCHSAGRTERFGACTFLGLDCSDAEWKVLCTVGSRLSWFTAVTQSDFGLPRPPPEFCLYYVTKEDSLRLFPKPVAQLIRRRWKERGGGFWSSCLAAAFVITSHRDRLAATVVHELSHGCLNRSPWGLRIPLAVLEGYAQLTEDRFLRSGESSHSWLRAVSARRQALWNAKRLSVASVCQTDHQALREADHRDKALFYSYATLLTDYFSHLPPRTGTGDSILPAIWRARAYSSSDCVQRIAAATGYSVEELEQGFRDYCSALPQTRVY